MKLILLCVLLSLILHSESATRKQQQIVKATLYNFMENVEEFSCFDHHGPKDSRDFEEGSRVTLICENGCIKIHKVTSHKQFLR